MKKLGLVIGAVLTMFQLSAAAQQSAFQAGEKISYTVFYNVIGIYINAGTATFTTLKEKYNNNDVYHVIGEGTTNSKYDWIFKVRDRYESYFDTDNLKPVKFIRNINEGGYKKYEEVTFNDKANIAITNVGVFKVPEQIQDVISTLYYARNLDYSQFKAGDKIPFNMFLDNKVYSMYIRYLGKEKVKTKFGTFEAIKLKPLLLKGHTFNGGENMTVWVTNDSNHIPVRIESPISVGSVKVDLMNYKFLKHPLNSLLATAN